MAMNRIGVNDTEGARTASVLTVFAGIWLIIAPFWMGYWTAPAPLWNSLVVGIVVGILALVRACYPARNVELSWISLIWGIWMVVSPFLLPYHDLSVALYNDAIAGAVIAVLSLWSALATPASARYVR